MWLRILRGWRAFFSPVQGSRAMQAVWTLSAIYAATTNSICLFTFMRMWPPSCHTDGVSCTGPTCGIDTLPEVKLEEVFRSLYEACKDGNPECFRDDGIGRSRTHDDATRSLVLPWFPDAESNPSLVSPGALYCNTPESKWFKPWTWWTDAYGDLAKGGTKRDAASIGSVQAPDQPVGATCVGSVRRTLDNNYVTGTHGSVVRLFIVKRNVKSGKLEVGVCTGTLVRRGRVLTAAHCFELAPGLRHHATIVVFGYTALPWDASGNHEKLSSLGKDGVRLAAVSENTGYAVAWPKDWYPIPMLDVAVVNIPGAPASVPISAAASFVTAGLGDSKSDPVPVKAYGAAGTAWCLSSCGGVASSAVAMQSSEATCVLAGSAKSKTGFLNFANLLSPVFGAMIYCPLSLFAGWSGGPLVKDDGLTSPVFGLNNYATLVDLTGFPSLGVPALTDCTNGGSPWRYGTPPLPTAGYNITSARFCYGEVSAGGATLLHGNQFAPIIDQDLVRQYPQLSQLAPDLCMTNDLISTMTCAGATGAGITCDNPYSYSEEASADGAVYTAVVDILASSGAPVSKLSFRWDMYTNPDRLQVYNYQTNGTRGALLLDTGFVGVQYNGCTRSDPINPAVTVVPSTNAASCASKDGCLGLTGYYRDTGACSVPTTQACVAEGFDAVSKVQVVVTSACAGSAWALEIKCG